MPPFAESRNFRGWWESKTSLEQKLIILCSVLSILSFCLLISVIVINNKKPAGGGGTTVSPIPSESTVSSEASSSDMSSTQSTTETDTSASTTTDATKKTSSTIAEVSTTDISEKSEVVTDAQQQTDAPVDGDKLGKDPSNKDGNNGGSAKNNPISQSLDDGTKDHLKRSLPEFNLQGIHLQRRR